MEKVKEESGQRGKDIATKIMKKIITIMKKNTTTEDNVTTNVINGIKDEEMIIGVIMVMIGEKIKEMIIEMSRGRNTGPKDIMGGGRNMKMKMKMKENMVMMNKIVAIDSKIRISHLIFKR